MPEGLLRHHNHYELECEHLVPSSSYNPGVDWTGEYHVPSHILRWLDQITDEITDVPAYWRPNINRDYVT